MSLHPVHLLLCLLLTITAAPASAQNPGTPEPQDQAAQLLRQTQVRGGLIVHSGCGNGSLTLALRQSDSFQVHGLEADPALVEQARSTIRNAGLYGEVSVIQHAEPQLPYVDNSVNLLIADTGSTAQREEILRVLVPNGQALLRQPDGQWQQLTKPRPASIDEWSHYLHDASGNAVAHDTVVNSPRHLQWVGSPRWSRHHDRMASMSALVSTNGRMFYIMDEGSRISIQLPSRWKLIARDAFNGVILWKRDITDWQNHLWPLKSGPTHLARRLISADHEVYSVLSNDGPLEALDAATGKTLRTYEGSAATEEVILSNGILFTVSRKGPGERDSYAPANGRVGDQAKVGQEFFWNEEPRVIMAFEAATGKQLWARQTRISPLTLAADQHRVYYHDGESLTALDPQSGNLVWASEPVTRRRQFTFNFGPRLVVWQDVVLYAGGDGKMISVDSASGKQLWESDHPNSGYQSPQDLMVVDGLVWCAPTTSGKDTGVFTGRDPRSGAGCRKQHAEPADQPLYRATCHWRVAC